jgi:hypothetical protein
VRGRGHGPAPPTAAALLGGCCVPWLLRAAHWPGPRAVPPTLLASASPHHTLPSKPSPNHPRPPSPTLTHTHTTTSPPLPPPGECNPCIFEYIYLARPDSVLNSISVYLFQLGLGTRLAKKIKKQGWDIDVVVPVPDGSRPSAIEVRRRRRLRSRGQGAGGWGLGADSARVVVCGCCQAMAQPARLAWPWPSHPRTTHHPPPTTHHPPPPTHHPPPHPPPAVRRSPPSWACLTARGW